MTGCAATVTCLNACAPSDQTCQMTCFTNATPQGGMLLQSLLQCLETACPSMGGGVCDSSAMGYSATACQQCVSGAQSGACASQAQACAADMGGGTGGCTGGQTSCGGTCTDLTSDVANCGACGNACMTGQSCAMGKCSTGTMTMTGCDATLACINACAPSDVTCQNACVNNATTMGKTLLQALAQCVATACPNKNGGVCDQAAMGYSATACQTCVSSSQMAGGSCVSQLQACRADGGGGCAGGQTMCAGQCTDTTTDAANCGTCGHACANTQSCQAGHCVTGGGGGMTGCKGLIACTNACMSQSCANNCISNTTQTGQGLYQTLSQCLETACPSTNGDICDQTSIFFDPYACDQCYHDAQIAGGSCYPDLQTCLNNTP
jgi:hypothetical protein